jgi:hypothetical protein
VSELDLKVDLLIILIYVMQTWYYKLYRVSAHPRLYDLEQIVMYTFAFAYHLYEQFAF